MDLQIMKYAHKKNYQALPKFVKKAFSITVFKYSIIQQINDEILHKH